MTPEPVDIKGKTWSRIIKEASGKEVVVWERPENDKKKNLEVERVKELVASFPNRDLIPRIFSVEWKPRESDKGTNAKTGEKEVFIIRYCRKRFRKEKRFYFKGFLFHENCIVGAEYR